MVRGERDRTQRDLSSRCWYLPVALTKARGTPNPTNCLLSHALIRLRKAGLPQHDENCGTTSSNPLLSSGESTNHRFLGGGAASAVCHEPVPLYARAAVNMRTTDQSCPGPALAGARSGVTPIPGEIPSPLRGFLFAYARPAKSTNYPRTTIADRDRIVARLRGAACPHNGIADQPSNLIGVSLVGVITHPIRYPPGQGAAGTVLVGRPVA